MLRRPVFWIGFIALSFAAAIFTFKYFSTAFPLVAIDVRMDRTDALRVARSLAEKNSWPPKGFDQAAEFGGDQEVQNFIELEGGGKPELSRILNEKIFAPYTWRVRHYKEADAHETLVRFTPEGEPYGFYVKLPDQEPGDSISTEEAQRIAEEAARNDWRIDFNRRTLVESSKDVRPGGRTDHSFVYERQDERSGEGRFRLRLVVSGNKLTELTHFVQIPEAFTRRYEQMRSANEAINVASSVAVVAIYILGFCGIGLFFMIRQRWVIWRPAAFWAIFIALLVGLQQLNAWPLVWMNYDTAVPASGYALRQVMNAVGAFGALALLLIVSFAAAETLSRRAFPHHVQLWKAWARPTASSWTILGQTSTGYLLVALFFAYEIVLYFFAQGKLGWWTPSDTLVNPDLFANYVPSLSAIALASQAGFWEECLFRAAPLATAALIGEKLGKRRLFIGIAMVFQAIVFASGHAGYANQPAYARVVELIIPSFVFGTVYLMFGLLPGIVLHFTYDTAWMALPLFVSSTNRAHIEQAIVVLAVLVPLWAVLISRVRSGAWTEAPNDVLNSAWKPKEAPEPPQAAPRSVVPATAISTRVSRALPVVGLAGLIVWVLASPFRADAPRIEISRSEAERRARVVLENQNVKLDSSWTVLSRVEGQPGEINRFVWQTAGPSHYQKLLGVYVTPPSWFVRFVRFQGDVADRAEEYGVYLRGNGEPFRFSHDLPEARPGKSLTEAEARAIAVSALPDSGDFKEVSAQAAKRPARTDWTFVFKDTRDYGLPQGEPRVSIGIAGDAVVDIVRFVYVPEDWSRSERARRNAPSILGAIYTVFLVAMVAAGAVVGAIHWSRKRPFSVRAFAGVFGVVFLTGAVNVLNSWPILASQASTAQPLALQVGIGMVTGLVFAIITSGGLAMVAGLVAGERPSTERIPFHTALLIGVSVGCALAGAGALARLASPSMSPLWGNLAPAAAFVPFFAAALGPIGTVVTQALILLLVLYVVNLRSGAAALWLVLGIALAGSASIETIPSWLIVGAATGLALMIAYRLVFRHQPKLILISTATLVILGSIRDGVQGMYPLALFGSFAGALLVALLASASFRGSMNRPA